MDLQTTNSLIHMTDREFEEIFSFVYKKYGIDLRKKRHLIEGRLSYTLKARGMNTFSEYMKVLFDSNSSEEMQAFLNKITTNHSYFGRENEHFDFLMHEALPQLTKTRKQDLRIWSAGCSAGQEAYNIAMVMDQFFGPQKNRWDTTVLATDISSKVLSQAKQGIYPEEHIKNMPAQWKKEYFQLLPGGTYQVVEKIRKEVVYRIFNLMDTFQYKKPFDIIFCRNVMIYFDAETTRRLIEKFYEATAEGGYLFIGHSESLAKGSPSEYTYLRPSVYQKITRGGRR
ncbi:CheR family methyltransferase [Scatolibacter rhodanostii]|uniref:CheR family methyltransferase n=1 Tax=Scatolibacter rhodanostii TaxID=2014781 RepID=UPI00117DB3C1|nr:protein-glutamate O-methyltransferase CheR [Scatolibacter rhodanostii]